MFPAVRGVEPLRIERRDLALAASWSTSYRRAERGEAVVEGVLANAVEHHVGAALAADAPSGLDELVIGGDVVRPACCASTASGVVEVVATPPPRFFTTCCG